MIIKKLKVGLKINKLTLLEKCRDKKGYNNSFLCLCECGNKKIIRTNDIKRENTKSCGFCSNMDWRRNHTNPLKASAKNIYSKTYNDGDLTFDDFYELSQMNCYYCGRKPQQFHNSFSNKKGSSQYAISNGLFIYNGLDRVDSNKPHNKDNVVPCCKICNYAKRDMTIEQFKTWVLKIYKHWAGKK